MMTVAQSPNNQPRFPLGRFVATPAALAALMSRGLTPRACLYRCVTESWRDLGEEDKQANERVPGGTRLFSAYNLSGGETVMAHHRVE